MEKNRAKRFNKAKRFKAVLFDKDGVLLNSIKSCLRATNETLKHYGKSEVSENEYKKKFWGTRADVNITRTFKELPESKRKEIYNYYKKKRIEFEGLSKLYPSTIPLLQALKGKYKLGVITSTFSDIATKLLEDFRILNYFDIVVSGEEAKPKPAPDPILKACELLGVEPAEAIYVGDTIPDIEAGKAAGCTVVIVTTSMSRKELAGIEDIIIIDDLKDLKEILSA